MQSRGIPFVIIFYNSTSTTYGRGTRRTHPANPQETGQVILPQIRFRLRAVQSPGVQGLPQRPTHPEKSHPNNPVRPGRYHLLPHGFRQDPGLPAPHAQPPKVPLPDNRLALPHPHPHQIARPANRLRPERLHQIHRPALRPAPGRPLLLRPVLMPRLKPRHPRRDSRPPHATPRLNRPKTLPHLNAHLRLSRQPLLKGLLDADDRNPEKVPCRPKTNV